MKKITLLLLFTITILSACKKDDAERNSDRLIGRWNVESVAYIEYENGKEIEREQYSNQSLVWEFRNDGSATVNFDGGDEILRWSATENTLVFTRDGDEKLEFKINSLTKNKLHIVFEDRSEVQNGITYSQTIEFILRK